MTSSSPSSHQNTGPGLCPANALLIWGWGLSAPAALPACWGRRREPARAVPWSRRTSGRGTGRGRGRGRHRAAEGAELQGSSPDGRWRSGGAAGRPLVRNWCAVVGAAAQDELVRLALGAAAVAAAAAAAGGGRRRRGPALRALLVL